MVAANFLFVFLGIESPDEASLRETKKYQNLRQDPLSAIRMLQERGLWVMGASSSASIQTAPTSSKGSKSLSSGPQFPGRWWGFYRRRRRPPV